MKYRRLDANTLYAAAILFSRPSLHRDPLPWVPNHYRGSLIIIQHCNNDFYSKLRDDNDGPTLVSEHSTDQIQLQQNDCYAAASRGHQKDNLEMDK